MLQNSDITLVWVLTKSCLSYHNKLLINVPTLRLYVRVLWTVLEGHFHASQHAKFISRRQPLFARWAPTMMTSWLCIYMNLPLLWRTS